MNLTSPKNVTELLASLNFRPSKTLGQNFLIDGNILRIMLDTAEVGPDDQVLEIGPGLGVVTEGLLARAKRVVAIELDKRLYAYLRAKYAGNSNLELIPGDALDAKAILELADLGGHCGRIGGVALEHLHRDRTALGGAHQAKDDLRIVALAIARMTAGGQLAAASGQPG